MYAYLSLMILQLLGHLANYLLSNPGPLTQMSRTTNTSMKSTSLMEYEYLFTSRAKSGFLPVQQYEINHDIHIVVRMYLSMPKLESLSDRLMMG